MKKYLLDILISLLLGIGLILLISPVLLYWWIHGNYERYIWIISGPAPYNNFGSGPYQLFVFLLFPVVLGILLMSVSFFVKKKLLK